MDKVSELELKAQQVDSVEERCKPACIRNQRLSYMYRLVCEMKMADLLFDKHARETLAFPQVC